MRIPDIRVFWSQKIRETADKIIEENGIKYLLTTTPPPSLHQVGVYLRRKYNLHWLADFRDPWQADDLTDITPIHAYIRKKLEHNILEYADYISVVTTTHQHDLQGRFPEYKDKINYIPNGYDPDDFMLKPNPPKDKLTLTHCGTMCSRFSVLAFFEALKKAVNQKSELKNKIEFVQIGNVDEDIFHTIWKMIIDNI